MHNPKEKNKSSIEARLAKDKEAIIGELKKLPIVHVACERAGISRATYYRWRSEDEEFVKNADQAMMEGELFVNDMSESQLISLIKDKHFPSISLWLRQHHPRYANKLEIIARKYEPEILTAEQEKIIQEALQLASFDSLVPLATPKELQKDDNKRTNSSNF